MTYIEYIKDWLFGVMILEIPKETPLAKIWFSKNTWIWFEDAEWAPGIWAGAEGMHIRIEYDDEVIYAIIKEVNLEHKGIKVNYTQNIKPNGIIYYNEQMP